MSAMPEIRHRLRVVEDTRKITRAMYLISSAKMKRAMAMHDRNEVFFHRVRSDVLHIVDYTDAENESPFFTLREGGRAAYLIIAGDKGMCGAYNDDVLRLAERTIAQRAHKQVFLFTVGHMASAYFERKGMEPDVRYLHVSQNPQLYSARDITLEMCELYEAGQLDEVYVVYTHMESTTRIVPTVMRLLPIVREDYAHVEQLHPHPPDLIFHPSPEEVLARLVTQLLIGLTYTACVQAYASEHCARMTAMDASTRNADEMLGKLRLELNRARQAAITQELTEIIAGANSVR